MEPSVITDGEDNPVDIDAEHLHFASMEPSVITDGEGVTMQTFWGEIPKSFNGAVGDHRRRVSDSPPHNISDTEKLQWSRR